MAASEPPALAVAGQHPGPRRLALPLGPRAYRWTATIVLATLLLLAAYVKGSNDGVDWLLVSATATLGLGLLVAHRLPDEAENTLARLGDRGALLADQDRLAAACRAIERQVTRYWAPICGSIVAAAVFSAFLAWPGLQLTHAFDSRSAGHRAARSSGPSGCVNSGDTLRN